MGDIYFLLFSPLFVFSNFFFLTLTTRYLPSNKKIFTVSGGFLGWGICFSSN